MRGLWCGLLLWVGASASAQQILLVPLDSRPAAGQFAQMIGRMANVPVIQPPPELLGRFTVPGRPDALMGWLEQQNMTKYSAVVVSTDMIAYGGLIASRESVTTYETAQSRLRRFATWRRKHPNVRVYGMTAIMRLFPTATRASASWRMQLGKYAEVKDRYRRTREPKLFDQLLNLQAKIPPLEIAAYEAARERNLKVHQMLIRMTSDGTLDYLIHGQDDAQPFGPHIAETEKLKALVNSMEISGKNYFCEGVDQLSNILVSRALLRANNWTPRVRIMFSDEAGKRKIANYESKNIDLSLRDQLVASGARPWTSGDYDYTLWLNTPDPAEAQFAKFINTLVDDIDQGFPVGIADINLGKTGTGDERLFNKLWENDRMVKLLSYAGWNTAGNTMGTSIPAANVYLLARRIGSDPVKRELAQREFVLHRFVNDFAYHKFVRPSAYKMIDSLPNASREETYGQEFQQVNALVQSDVARYLNDYFEKQFKGKRFFAGSRQYEITNLTNTSVSLPWPRAYEVRLAFQLVVKPVAE